MRPVIQGAKLGLSECRWQFRHHHWNCSVLPTKKPMPVILPPAAPASDIFALEPEQKRVFRDNRNTGRKRKTRNYQNATDNLNIGRNSYSIEPQFKPKKRNRKNLAVISIDETSTNNFVLTGGTSSTSSSGKKMVENHPPYLHYYDKEEKANWNSMLTRG